MVLLPIHSVSCHMAPRPPLLLCLALLLLGLSGSRVIAFRVAVIGGGIAGASAALYLREGHASDAGAMDVTVFEREAFVGGRVRSIHFAPGVASEAGAPEGEPMPGLVRI